MQGRKAFNSKIDKATCASGSTGVVAAKEARAALEAALKQMDGIISGSEQTNANGNAASQHAPEAGPAMGVGCPMKLTTASSVYGKNLISAANVVSIANTLALALQQVGLAAPEPEASTATIINDWLETHSAQPDLDDRLRLLQHDKEKLAQEYQIIYDRASEQAKKITELEGLLAEKTQELNSQEEQLQRLMLSRSALETQKLELISALSELKLHRAALGCEHIELKSLAPKMNNKQHPSVAPFGSMGSLNQNHSLDSEFDHGMGKKTPTSFLRHQIYSQFHSLPRRSSAANNHNNNNIKLNNKNCFLDANANGKHQQQPQPQRNVAFASNEKILIEDEMSGSRDDEAMHSSFVSHFNLTPSPNLRDRSIKGLRTIFGKLRRSNSGNLELPNLEQEDPEFKRGGARATTSGRIEWTPQFVQLSHKNYAVWTPQEVCNWLRDLGLGCYTDDCRKWLDTKGNGGSFFTASQVEIESNLSLKMPLHCKKIWLAINELTGREDEKLALKAALLDVTWVLRWLDDIGLPQYKDSFLNAKVDGRLLHHLTMEDLAQLQVYSHMHIASFKRGIQCMRKMEWNPDCLIRRSSSSARKIDNYSNTDENHDRIELGDQQCVENPIALWTAHRVMEWLRVVDLSEYAPNLRGAGVHGGLMLYEKRFNANLLADLLSIPPSKTLLRRHLATHFKELLGRDIIIGKRNAEMAPGYQPLAISDKMKPPKKTQFSLKRRKSTKGCTAGEIIWTDYVCPMNVNDEELNLNQNEVNNSMVSSISTNSSINAAVP